MMVNHGNTQQQHQSLRLDDEGLMMVHPADELGVWDLPGDPCFTVACVAAPPQWLGS